MSKRLFICILFMVNLFGFAQIEREDTISAITIRGVQKVVSIDPVSKMQVYTIDSSIIQQSGAFSLGELDKTLPSVSIKDYGGLGGLKTVSIRGMGAQFTSVSIDNVPVLPFNSSQIDLSSIPLFYADNLSFSIGYDNIGSAYTQQFGGNLNLRTIGSKMVWDSNTVHIEGSVGSFGTYGGGAAYQHRKGRHQFSIGGQSNYSDGTFPYTLQNGNLIEEGERHSSSYFGSQLNTDYLFLKDSL